MIACGLVSHIQGGTVGLCGDGIARGTCNWGALCVAVNPKRGPAGAGTREFAVLRGAGRSGAGNVYGCDERDGPQYANLATGATIR
ncbi:hypothetical protein GCM10017687_49590 [Streptomyces echinatus]